MLDIITVFLRFLFFLSLPHRYGKHCLIRLKKPEKKNIPLLPQLPKTDFLIIMFVQHLRRRQVEIFLRHMHSAFAKRVHARLGAYPLEFRAGTAVHLLGDLGQVDAAREVHAAAVDT